MNNVSTLTEKPGVTRVLRSAAVCMLGIYAAVALTGCATIDPTSMERTARDEECYKGGRPQAQTQKKILVVSRAVPHMRNAETNNIELLRKNVESAAWNYFSNLGWFRTIDQDHGLVVDAREALNGTSIKRRIEKNSNADFVLDIESSALYIAKQGWKRTSHAKKARGVVVESNFRIIGVDTQELLIGAKFQSTAECGKGEIRAALSEAAEKNIRKFARVVSARYLPPGRVIETRGSGRCARLNIGKNYLLNEESDDIPATRVDFLEYSSQDTGKPIAVVVAHGRVIRAEKNEAWVEVDADWLDKTTGLATYAVKKGHFVKISEDAVEDETEVE